MIQKILIVKGRVQDKNYRETVKETADKLSVFGRVRNIVNGSNTVEILCQCNDDKHFQEFKKAIFIKSENNYDPNVEDIKEIDINPPKIVLKTFTVEYGDKQEEMIKKLNIGIQVMRSMNNNICNRFEKLDKKYDIVGRTLLIIALETVKNKKRKKMLEDILEEEIKLEMKKP